MTWVPPSNKPTDCEALMTRVPPTNNSKECKKDLSYTSIRLLLILWVIFWYPYSLCAPEAKYFTRFFRTPLNKFLRCPEANGLCWKRLIDLSSLNFDRRFPSFFAFVQGQPEMKSGHFMAALYTLYLAHEAMGIFYKIHWCHQVSFLACLHPIDPHCHKPHQQAFLLLTKEPGISF